MQIDTTVHECRLLNLAQTFTTKKHTHLAPLAAADYRDCRMPPTIAPLLGFVGRQ